MPLTISRIKSAKAGRHADEKGLYLLVQPSGSKSWVLRVQFNGRRRDFGLGSVEWVSLNQARQKATNWRALAKRGLDPSLATETTPVIFGPNGQKNRAAPSRTRMTQAERTALSDNRMYQATMELLCNVGIHRTTLKEVGERAGYSRGLASARFGSKEGLFASLVQNIAATWKAERDREVGALTGLAALLSVLDTVEHFLNEQPLYAKALYVLWYETVSSNNDVRHRLAVAHSDRNSVAAFIRQGQAEGSILHDVSAERFAVQFMSFIFGTIYQWHITPKEIDVTQMFRDYKATVMKQIGVPRKNARLRSNLLSASNAVSGPLEKGVAHDKAVRRASRASPSAAVR